MNVAQKLDLHQQSNLQSTDSQGLYTNPATKGVTASWLAQAFGIPEPTARYRLRNCPVKTNRARGTKMQVRLYDIKEAARHLITPAYSTKEYMHSLKRGDLPPVLQQAVWDAMLKRQKWEENAGDLWRTSQLREVLGLTFQTLKFTLQLWTETIERQSELSDEHRGIILEMVDALQGELYQSLVKNMNDNSTGSQLVELETQFGETDLATTLMTEDYDTDDADEDAEIEALV